MNNIKIEAISPIHIGDSEIKNLYSLSDFIADDNQLKLIDHKKLENIFEQKPEILEYYINEVKSHTSKSYSLKNFLNKHQIEIDDITESSEIPIIGNFTGKEINTFISTSGKNYIPGSTIKGAIRNAFAFAYLNEHPEMISNIISKHYRNKVDYSAEERYIFGKNPFSDILKFLQISDTSYFPKNSNAIYCCNNFHLKKQELSVPINYEGIAPNSETEFKIKITDNINRRIDRELDKNFWINHLSIENIFKDMNSLSKRFIERELDEIDGIHEMEQTVIFYEELLDDIKNSKNESAYFCIGKGGTILAKTVLLSLTKEELEELRNKMKNTKVSMNFGWKSVSGKGKQISSIFPVTRLVYENQNNWQAGFGWIKIKKM
ncbi:MAG: type III-A CRISPR-associated RAMP protein Csm5 [Candidatus Marinimicrobia bacterium]|nr:type III-A CRISPR-associated RAMP protein Csm5 [Candidatus Neomarinimicrobiota bacterium]